MSVPMKDEDIDSTSERSLPEESTYEGDASKRRKEIAILPSSCTSRWTTPILRSNFTPWELASVSHPFLPSFSNQPLHQTYTDLLRPQPVTLFPVPSGSCVPRIPTQLRRTTPILRSNFALLELASASHPFLPSFSNQPLHQTYTDLLSRWTTPILRSNFTPRELASASHPFFPSFRKQPLHHTFTDLLSRWTTTILRSNFEVKRELASGSHPFLPSFSIKPLLQTFTDLLRPQTDAVFPEPSHTMNRDFPKIQPQSSLSQPQQSTPEPINRRTPLPPNGLIPIHLSHSPSYSRTIFTNKAAGVSSRLHWPFTIHRSQESGEFTDEPLNIKNYECDDETFRITKEYFGDASAENEIESISDRSVVPEVFTPESNPYNDRKSYRFPCSSEGLFQCRYTGLVFKMDTGGEVQYRTEPWNYTQLAKRNYVPAGPLFDIKCPQGTLSQIRFPHCEVFSGEGHKRLSVVHISDSDEYEMLDPHKTTDSHVVLNISGCSKYGLTKRQPKKKCSPINGLVLLYLYESKLNVLLLPKNVDISEVYEKRKKMKEPAKEIYIETPANCELVPKKKYYLSSDPEEHEVTPVRATFLDYENYSNYISTFQVSLTKLERVKLNLKRKGSDECVWYSNLTFSASLIGGCPSVFSPSSAYTPPGQDFFHKHKAALETRLGLLRPILSKLETHRVLNPQEREEVQSKKSNQEQNESLLLMLKKKGGPAQEEFYKVLKECDEYLVKDLEGPYRTYET